MTARLCALTIATLMLALPALCRAAPPQEDIATGSILGDRPVDGTGSADWRQMLDEVLASPTPIDEGWARQRPALGLSTIEVRNRVIVLEDEDGRIFDQGFFGLGGNSTLNSIAQQVYAALPDDFHFITIMVDWNVQGAFAFYLPLANDTRGIGYGNLTDGDEIFDQTAGPLMGFVFMNNWRYYTRGPEADALNKIVWLQEIGHRWGAFVNYDNGAGPRQDLLGRDRSHWSYFMHSQNSALEGNDWNDNNDGSFSTFTNASRMTFSDLDLYLMGVAAPEEVPPFFVIRNADTGNLRDARGANINRASPPETEGSIKTILGDRDDVTIEDIINHEGPRVPDHINSQKTFRMATVFVTRDRANISAGQLEQIEGVIENWERLFEEATREEMNLITVLDGDEAPTDLAFGAPCTESAQCDPSQSTTCLTTRDGDRICSRRCLDDAECGQEHCCDDPSETGNFFCHPVSELCPSMASDPAPDPEDTTLPDPSPDLAEQGPDDDEMVVITSADASDTGCRTAPGSVGHSWLLLLGLLALMRRRASAQQKI